MIPTGPLQKAIVNAIKNARQPIYIDLETVQGFDGAKIRNALNRLVNGGLITPTDDGRYRLTTRGKKL